MAVNGWSVTFGTTARRALGRQQAAARPVPLLAVPNVTAHPSTASVGLPTSYYSMWHYIIAFAL